MTPSWTIPTGNRSGGCLFMTQATNVVENHGLFIPCLLIFRRMDGVLKSTSTQHHSEFHKHIINHSTNSWITHRFPNTTTVANTIQSTSGVTGAFQYIRRTHYSLINTFANSPRQLRFTRLLGYKNNQLAIQRLCYRFSERRLFFKTGQRRSQLHDGRCSNCI